MLRFIKHIFITNLQSIPPLLKHIFVTFLPSRKKQINSRLLVSVGDTDLIVLGFNDTSTLVGHFVSSPREREKRDRRDCRRDEREGQVKKTNKNESKETEEIQHSPSTLLAQL